MKIAQMTGDPQAHKVLVALSEKMPEQHDSRI